MPEFAHVKPSRLLVVAGEARRASRGTVKPLAFEGGKTRDRLGRRKPMVKVNDKRMLYCITLRPLFFRSGTAEARIGTLLHELFHISKKFDGTLSRERRHAMMGGKAFADQLNPIIRRYLKRCPPELWAPFAYDGEVLVQHWLERPPAWFEAGQKTRRVYTEDQLFYGVVRMVTKRTRPAKRPKARIKLH